MDRRRAAADCAAIRDADVERFPVYVTAFITDSVGGAALAVHPRQLHKAAAEGADPRTAPSTPAADLPALLLKRRYPAQLLDRLNYDPDSPLFRRIRTPTTAEGTIKDNSILKMLAMSIEDGALYQWFDPESGTGDTDAMLALLKNYWERGRRRLPGRLGLCAAAVAPRPRRRDPGARLRSWTRSATSSAKRESRRVDSSASIALVAADCHWTSGPGRSPPTTGAAGTNCRTPLRDIRALSDYLVRAYRRRVT